MKTEPKNTMRIVCGTDFPKPAAQAANAAAALAARLQETLVLVHSVEGAELGASSPKVFIGAHFLFALNPVLTRFSSALTFSPGMPSPRLS